MQPVRIERTRGPSPELEKVVEDPRTMIFCGAHFKTCIYVLLIFFFKKQRGNARGKVEEKLRKS